MKKFNKTIFAREKGNDNDSGSGIDESSRPGPV